jgi:hypothetical protein
VIMGIGAFGGIVAVAVVRRRKLKIENWKLKVNGLRRNYNNLL